MRAKSTSGTQQNAGRIAGVTLLIALVVGLGLAAGSSTLHQRFCPNAGKPDDSCAIAAFAGGTPTSSPTLLVLTAAVLMLVLGTRWTGEHFSSGHLVQLALSRAPPWSVQLPG
jgi:hypothetical protein